MDLCQFWSEAKAEGVCCSGRDTIDADPEFDRDVQEANHLGSWMAKRGLESDLEERLRLSCIYWQSWSWELKRIMQRRAEVQDCLASSWLLWKINFKNQPSCKTGKKTTLDTKS